LSFKTCAATACIQTRPLLDRAVFLTFFCVQTNSIEFINIAGGDCDDIRRILQAHLGNRLASGERKAGDALARANYSHYFINKNLISAIEISGCFHLHVLPQPARHYWQATNKIQPLLFTKELQWPPLPPQAK
jgi:hypothetical protein